MAKKSLLLVIALAFTLVSAIAAAADYKVGDKVEVLWKGKWYPAAVIEVKPATWKIHYDGYDSSWDEWVGQDRIRPYAPAWKVGDPVSVSWKGSWYPASILEIKNGKYKIHYDGYNASWDEWVGPERIKAR